MMLLYHNHINKRIIFKYANNIYFQIKRTNINLKILASLEQKKIELGEITEDLVRTLRR